MTKVYKLREIIPEYDSMFDSDEKKNVIMNPDFNEKSVEQIYSYALQQINDSNILDKDKQLVKSTYGEIKFDSVEKIIKELRINKNDIFYDLGSGNGKVTIHMYMRGVKKSYGIEFFPERSYNSEFALKKLYKMFPHVLDDDRLISFQIQNIKDMYYLSDATVIFMCSTCYPSELLDVVFEKVKSCKNIRAIITHKEYPAFLKILSKTKTIQLPCTWSDNLTWHIYYV